MNLNIHQYTVQFETPEGIRVLKVNCDNALSARYICEGIYHDSENRIISIRENGK